MDICTDVQKVFGLFLIFFGLDILSIFDILSMAIFCPHNFFDYFQHPCTKVEVDQLNYIHNHQQ